MGSHVFVTVQAVLRGSTLELRFQGRLTANVLTLVATVVAYLSGGQMNTVMLDYLCIQIFHNEIDIPF